MEGKQIFGLVVYSVLLISLFLFSFAINSEISSNNGILFLNIEHIGYLFIGLSFILSTIIFLPQMFIEAKTCRMISMAINVIYIIVSLIFGNYTAFLLTLPIVITMYLPPFEIDIKNYILSNMFKFASSFTFLLTIGLTISLYFFLISGGGFEKRFINAFDKYWDDLVDSLIDTTFQNMAEINVQNSKQLKEQLETIVKQKIANMSDNEIDAILSSSIENYNSYPEEYKQNIRETYKRLMLSVVDNIVNSMDVDTQIDTNMIKSMLKSYKKPIMEKLKLENLFKYLHETQKSNTLSKSLADVILFLFKYGDIVVAFTIASIYSVLFSFIYLMFVFYRIILAYIIKNFIIK